MTLPRPSSMREPQDVFVSLCVNDPDNGQDTGRVCAVHVDDDGETIELETGWLRDSDNPTYAIERVLKGGMQCARVRVGRHTYWIGGYRQWYGNWCWDAVTMTRREARRLIVNLLARGFTVTAGPVGSELLPAEAR